MPASSLFPQTQQDRQSQSVYHGPDDRCGRCSFPNVTPENEISVVKDGCFRFELKYDTRELTDSLQIEKKMKIL